MHVGSAQDGEGGVRLSAAGVGCGKALYWTIWAKVEVTCLNSMEKVVDVIWGLGKDMAENPSFVGRVGAKEGAECSDW